MINYGEKYAYDKENPFERTKMRMGIYDTTLDSLQLVASSNFTYYIGGTNFTPSSEVQINGEWYDTIYVNPTTLIITGQELDDFDRLAVIQRSNSSTRKASSEVQINGEWYDTIYVNPTTLIITGQELDDFDRLAVIQRSNSSTRKALSKSYDRSCYALYSQNKWKLPEK